MQGRKAIHKARKQKYKINNKFERIEEMFILFDPFYYISKK